MIKDFLKKIYIKTGNQKYDENHLGTLNSWRLLFYNLLSPGRSINRMRYNLFFPNKIKKINEFKKINFFKNESLSNNVTKENLDLAFKNLVEDGGVVINRYFSEKIINSFLEENKELIAKMKNCSSNEIIYKHEALKLSKGLLNIWLEDNMINFMKVYLGNKIYSRNYPYLIYTHVPKTVNQHLTSKVADSWHVDHSVLFNFHVLLEDIEETETCMEILAKSHLKPNIASLYSSKTVQTSSERRIKCYGKKGTVYMHTGNVIHRLNPKAGSNRLNLHFEFSPGTNILLDCQNIKKCLDSEFKIEDLDKSKRDIIRVIFPIKLSKGYEIKKDDLVSTRFKGI